MEIVVDRHIEDVFVYLADPRNEPRWSRRVVSVDGDAAHCEVVLKPGRFRAPRRVSRTRTAFEPPARLAWRDDDGTDHGFALESVWTATRITHGGRATRADLNELKRVLERG